MKQELLFGAAYYPEYMPEDRIDTDFAMMRSAGINVIRIAESTWSTWEPENGKFDFSLLLHTLDKALEYDLQVIVGTPTYAIPAWMAREHPDVMVQTPAEQRRYGHRQYHDTMNPHYRFYAERIIRKMMEAIAEHPAIIGYQLDNEMRYAQNVGPYMLEAFRKHMQEKFGTPQALNRAYYLPYWSNAIAAWRDFPNPTGTINGGIAGEFDFFRRDQAAAFLDWQKSILLEYKKPEQFITHNCCYDFSKGYSYGVRDDINHYRVSQIVDVCGCDIYFPSQSRLTGAEIAFGGDAARSHKRKNYLVLETQSQGFKNWTPYPGQLRLQAFSHVASGADSVMYWNWHSIHNSAETYWKGILSHDLQPNPIYRELCRVGKEFQSHTDVLLHTRKENRVALVTDNQSMTALRWWPLDKDCTYNDVVRWVYDALYELNISCDVVDVNALNVENYRWIITPALYSATQQTIDQLRSFVSNGGTLVSTLRSFVADEHFSVWPDLAPHDLTDVFGASYQLITAVDGVRVEHAPAKYLGELLCADPGRELYPYDHPYWKQYSAVTENSFGQGKAYYIGTMFDKSLLKSIFRKIRGELSARFQFRDALADVEFPVIIRESLTQQGAPIRFVMNYSSDEGELICPYPRVKDILTGRSWRQGEKIMLTDWDILVLMDA